MELWIRSQDKESLVQVDCLCIEKNEIDKGKYIYSNFDIVQGCITLGTYKTKERALEVLDEIQNILVPKIKYTKGKINGSFNSIIIRNEDTAEIKEFSTFVYQMPKE